MTDEEIIQNLIDEMLVYKQPKGYIFGIPVFTSYLVPENTIVVIGRTKKVIITNLKE